MQNIEFYYDFGSPNAYLVHKVLPKVAADLSAKIIYKPVLIGGVFKATNNSPPMFAFSEIPGKVEYMRIEMARFIERHALAFEFNPHFPVNSLNLMRAAVFAQGKPWEQTYIDVVFDAMWMDGKNMSDLTVFEQVLSDASLPVDQIKNAIQDAEIKTELTTLTSDSVGRKIFGLPTLFLGDEMFYGKDALNDLEWRLRQ